MQIFGHRGASREHPENTLPAFERALELGCDGIELDVWLARDGIPAVIHDETVDRTTDGVGRIVEFTMRQLRELDAGGSGVPSLGEVLALAAGRARVNIEIKDPAAVVAALEETREHPGLDFFFSSEYAEVLRHLRRLDPHVVLYPLTEQHTLTDALQLAREVGAEGLSISAEGLDASRIRALTEAGLAVWVWTVNDPAIAAALQQAGVDALCTDDPGLLLAG